MIRCVFGALIAVCAFGIIELILDPTGLGRYTPQDRAWSNGYAAALRGKPRKLFRSKSWKLGWDDATYGRHCSLYATT